MKSLKMVILIDIVVCVNAAYEAFDYSFEFRSCQDPPHLINPHNSEVILLSYQGGRISCDHMAISASKDLDLVKFQLMINPMYHEDPDCAISLKYKSSLQSKALTTFNCSWFAVEKYFLKMTRNSTFYVQLNLHTSVTLRARFKLKIIPMDAEFNTEEVIGVIAGGTIGGLLLICLIGFGCCIFRKRQKQEKKSENVNKGTTPT